MPRRKNLTRRRVILDNTFNLIRKNGMNNVSLKMIAEKSNISKSLLQSYYPHKQSLTAAIMHSIFNMLWDQINAKVVAPDETTYVKAKVFIYVIEALGQADNGLDGLIRHAFTNNKTLNYWSDMVNSWLIDHNVLDNLTDQQKKMMPVAISFMTTGGGRLYVRKKELDLGIEQIADIMTTTLMSTFMQYDNQEIDKVLVHAHNLIEKVDVISILYSIDHLFDTDKKYIQGV